MLHLCNATVYDGTGADPQQGDLLIDGMRIVAVGRFMPPAQAQKIDLCGQAVAPGFIDLHSHSDLHVLDANLAKTRQGVTTEVVGNCGFSAFPHCGCPDEVGAYNNGILSSTHTFASLREYRTALSGPQVPAHIETLVGHGTLRTAALRKNPALHGKALTVELCRLLDQALGEGAAGFSTGLMYAPGATAPLSELQELCTVTAQHGKLYATHMRSYSWELEAAVDEQLQLARSSRCRLQISHLQAAGRANWHRQQASLHAIECAHAEGVDVAFDAYPYLAGSTVLSQLLPQHVWERGFASYSEHIAAPDVRRELASWLDTHTAQRWCDILISSHAPFPSGEQLARQNIADYAEAHQISGGEAILDLIERSQGQINIIAFNQSEENLRQLLTHPLAAVISDGLYTDGIPHPRLYGSFVHWLGYYVRQLNWLSLPQAIYKITGFPASRLGLRDRGRLTAGSLADIVCFDPAEIASPATYETPRACPTGIRAVYRNGTQIYPAVQPAG